MKMFYLSIALIKFSSYFYPFSALLFLLNCSYKKEVSWGIIFLDILTIQFGKGKRSVFAFPKYCIWVQTNLRVKKYVRNKLRKKIMWESVVRKQQKNVICKHYRDAM